MNAKDQLNEKLAKAKREQAKERRWSRLFVVVLVVWTALVVPPIVIWPNVIPWGVAVTVYAAGVAAIVAWTWVRVSD